MPDMAGSFCESTSRLCIKTSLDRYTSYYSHLGLVCRKLNTGVLRNVGREQCRVFLLTNRARASYTIRTFIHPLHGELAQSRLRGGLIALDPRT
jgi:hypothetical protein